MADPAGAPPGPTLPAAAQKTLVDEISKTVEALIAILDFLKAAPVSEDPAAMVPPEVTEKLEQIGMMLMALGDQFEPVEVAAPAEAGGVEMAADQAAAPVVMTAENVAMTKALGKAIAVQMGLAILKRMASPSVAKAKVKLSFEQHAALQSKLMSGLLNMMKEVAPLMNGMDDADVAAALPPAAVDVDPAAAEAKKKADEEAAAKALAEEEAAKNAGVAKSYEDALAKLTKRLGTTEAELQRLGKSRGAPNGEPPVMPPATVVEEITYGTSLVAEALAKHSKTKPATTAASTTAGAAQ